MFKRTILGGEHITGATSGIDERSASPQVSVSLDSEGGDIMANTTKMNLKKPMATLYVEYKDSGKKDANGKSILEKHEEVINVATIQGRFGSQFQITGIDCPADAIFLERTIHHHRAEASALGYARL